MDREDKSLKRLIYFILASLLLHVGLSVFFFFLHGLKPSSPKLPPNQEVVFIRPEDIIPPSQGLPIADIAKPKIEKVPKRATALSQYNSAVEEETVARRVPKKADVNVDVSEDSGRKSSPAKPAEKPKQQASRPTPEDDLKTEPKESAAQEGRKVSLSDLELKTSDFKDLMKEGEGEKSKEERDKEVSRKIAALPRESGPSGPGDRFVHDFLPNIKIGDKTYINALAHPDVQYFTRLKRIFRLRFDPREPLVRHFRSNRVIVGQVNVSMAMEVSSTGQLTNLFVLKSSGIPDYDREALRTVRQSAPFSAPPKDIQGKDGVLRMTWNFTTYL
jgi:TonB family protein